VHAWAAFAPCLKPRSQIPQLWIAVLSTLNLNPERFLLMTGGTVLHLGCGTSDLSVALSREAPHAKIVNADFSEECLNIMRARHPQEHWVAMDARNLPLQDGCLHAIVEKGARNPPPPC
jgi:ubiquinone/menaquinone biosynthesis C-methylase UbiE